MSIGTTIKKLRREHDITQEQLAEYLGITSRAVSQWECDKTAPDISLLPMLANIFGVTTDVILGVDIQKNEEKIAQIIEEANVFSYDGKFASAVKILKDGIKHFPTSYRIMAELAEALSCVDLDSNANIIGKSEDAVHISNEVFSLCEKIISECTNNEIRGKAFQTIIYRYKNIGRIDKAAEYANMMSHMWVSREEMLIDIFDNNVESSLLRYYVSFCADRIMKCLDILSTMNIYNADDKNKLLHQITDIAKIIYCDGDYNYYAHHLISAYQTLAENYALVNDKEKTLLMLEQMCKASIMYDTYADNVVETSPAVRGEYHRRPVPWDENSCARLFKCLSDEKWYDFIRSEPQFTKMLDELIKYSNI